VPENIRLTERKFVKYAPDKWLAKSTNIRRSSKEHAAAGNKKGQPITVDLSLLVEVAGFEPASANPLPQDLHA